MSTLWLWKDITWREWKNGFHCCISLILDKNCFHFQLNFMSLMGNLPTIAFCYLVWMHYTKSELAFCILEWTDLSGYKQFYLYCAQFNHVNICMNFNSKIKAHNLWLKDLETASVIVFNTRHFLNVYRWCISWVTWETLFTSAVAPWRDHFPQRIPRYSRWLFCPLDFITWGLLGFIWFFLSE